MERTDPGYLRTIAGEGMHKALFAMHISRESAYEGKGEDLREIITRLLDHCDLATLTKILASRAFQKGEIERIPKGSIYPVHLLARECHDTKMLQLPKKIIRTDKILTIAELGLSAVDKESPRTVQMIRVLSQAVQADYDIVIGRPDSNGNQRYYAFVIRSLDGKTPLARIVYVSTTKDLSYIFEHLEDWDQARSEQANRQLDGNLTPAKWEEEMASILQKEGKAEIEKQLAAEKKFQEQARQRDYKIKERDNRAIRDSSRVTETANERMARGDQARRYVTCGPGDPEFTAIQKRLLIPDRRADQQPKFIAISSDRIVPRTEARWQHEEEKRIADLLTIIADREAEYFMAVSDTQDQDKMGYAALVCDRSIRPPGPQKIIIASNQRENAIFIVHTDIRHWQQFALASKNQLRYCQSIPGLVDVVRFSKDVNFSAKFNNLLNKSNVELPADFSMDQFADESKFLPAPSGWQTVDSLFRQCRGSTETLEAKAEAIVADLIAVGRDRRELADYYISNGNVIILHYAEEVCTKLKEQSPDPDQETMFEKGWKTVEAMLTALLARGIHIGFGVVERKAKEMFKERSAQAGIDPKTLCVEDISTTGTSFYYEPAFAAEIMYAIEDERAIPEGYLKVEPSGVEIYNLVLASGVTPVYDAVTIALNIPDEAAVYRSANPEWVQNKIDERGKNHDYYSRELRAKLAEDLAPFLAQGGKYKEQLGSELKVSPLAIGKKIEQLNRPEWIKKWRLPGDGKRLDIIMPPLIALLQSEYQSAPPHMISEHEIAGQLGISLDMLRYKIKRLLAETRQNITTAFYMGPSQKKEKHWDRSILVVLKK